MFSLIQSIKNLFNASASPAQDRDDQYRKQQQRGGTDPDRAQPYIGR